MIVYIYETQAECIRDVFEFANVVKEKTGHWLALDVENLTDGVCNVKFLVTRKVSKVLNQDTIKQCIDEVADARDMNEYMTVTAYEVPDDWYTKGNYHKVAPHTVANVKRNYTQTSQVKFAKVYNDVFDLETV